MSEKSSTQRREDKLVKDLRALASRNPNHLKSKWKKLLNGWSMEAISRGKRLQQENPEQREIVIRGGQVDPEKYVYGILEKAERLLALCGPEVERLVGSKTRELLNHDCAKAFAMAVEPHLYWLSNAAHNEQLMKQGYQPPG